MTWRFRRTVSFGPLHFHFGKRHLGVSVGPRAAHLGIRAGTHRLYASAGLPGTGLSVQQNLTKGRP